MSIPDYVYVENVECPYCGSHDFEAKYVKDGCFRCTGFEYPSLNRCSWVGFYCSGCNTLGMKEDLGLRGDVYECKRCGKPHWGYTEFIRDNPNYLVKSQQTKQTQYETRIGPSTQDFVDMLGKEIKYKKEHPEYKSRLAVNYYEQYKQNIIKALDEEFPEDEP